MARILNPSTFNKMKQNDDKTEFLIIGTPGQLK